ncbi:MAG: DUF1080 domain-containing protein [Bacteroidaceae bacterium]|nr:DUF1080 domain-containing protein [Bacteroidaceae bacterium]
MKRIINSILLIVVSVVFGLTASAQLDSRNRTVETVVIDNLGQLPAQNARKYNQVMDELASTGEKGITLLAGMLGPVATTNNATFEYALNSVVDYVTAAGKESLRDGVRKGIVNGLAKAADKDNKAFLLTQLQKIATPSEAGIFESYLQDSYLQDYAVRGLAALPGIDTKVIDLMKAAVAPNAGLAYIAGFKKLQAAEPILINWKKTADTQTQQAINSALASCGGAAAIAALQPEAAKLSFGDDATGVSNAYLTLLNNCDNNATVLSAAKALVKAKSPAVRCAGLQMLLKSDSKNAAKNILAALKDPCRQYRTTALDFAKDAAGDGIISTVAAKSKGLSADAQTDVMRWLGNNKATGQIDVVNAAMNSANSELAAAAIEAAGRIGGEKALTAIVGQLGGANAAAASQALLAFNGDIKDGVLGALASSDDKVVGEALKLASARRISSAYGKVLDLTKSANPTIKDAALDALKGVVTADKFGEINQLLGASSGTATAKLQEAAKSALHSLDADRQFSTIGNAMATAKNAALYYPLLAQAGNSASIAKLMQEYKNGADKTAAYNALLNVDNPEIIPTLYNLAKDNAAGKDAALARYLSLANAVPATAEAKYLLLSKALALNPSARVQNAFIKALGETQTQSALNVVTKYLDQTATAAAAAAAVKTIIGKNEALQGGALNKAALSKAQAVYAAIKANNPSNADAGYAVDEIKLLAGKMGERGYADIDNNKEYENFELLVDYKGAGSLTARGIEVLSLPESEDWSTLYVKVVNDRLNATVNGSAVAENSIIKGGAPAGRVILNGVQTRAAQVKELASTPVFTLSPEEKEQGFEVLFDGRSLEKWHGNTTSYVPVDGNIYVTAHYGGNGNLYTNKKYSDFIYRFEFCFDVVGVNNGIGLRTSDGVDAAYEGMEIQVLDNMADIYRNLEPYQYHGSVYGIHVPVKLDFGPIRKWHTEEIIAKGDYIKVTVDSTVVTECNIREACQGHNVAPDGGHVNPYTIDHKNHPGLFNKDGYISFCGHGPGVMFRNVRILDLSQQPAAKGKKKGKK